MKSFLWLLLLILVLGFLLQMFLPWWIVTPLCFVLAAWQAETAGRAFGAGLLGIGLNWLVPAAWLTIQNHGLLAHRVAQLLPLGGSATLLVLVTALLGGLVGGLAALAGFWTRQAIFPTTPAFAPKATA
jgi:hypothetical protein